jgi:hypothetical protein
MADHATGNDSKETLGEIRFGFAPADTVPSQLVFG